MLPIIFSVAKQFGGSVLRYAFPSAGAFAVMHAFLPPHPGPVASGDLLGVNMGLLVIVGLVCAVPTWYIGTYLFSQFISKRVHVDLPKMFLNTNAINEIAVQNPPSFQRVLTVLLLPIVLILFDTGLNTLSVAKVIDGSALWVQSLRLIGKTPIALLITLLVAILLLKDNRSGDQIEKFVITPSGQFALLCWLRAQAECSAAY